MLEAASNSEKVAELYEITWRYNLEGSHLHTYRREKLKMSHSKEPSVSIGAIGWRSLCKGIRQGDVDTLLCVCVLFWRQQLCHACVI
jgi:hypothetical protein